MYTARLFLGAFAILVVSHYVTAQPPGFQWIPFFPFPIPPGLGGPGSNHGPGRPQIPPIPHFPPFPGIPIFPPGVRPTRPPPNSTQASTEDASASSVSAAASEASSEAASEASSAASSAASTAASSAEESTTVNSRRRRAADEQEAYTRPARPAPPANPEGASQQPDHAPPEHHNRFLDFHLHRGRRDANQEAGQTTENVSTGLFFDNFFDFHYIRGRRAAEEGQSGASGPPQPAPQQSENVTPEHHNRFLDFHLHRGRRDAPVAGY